MRNTSERRKPSDNTVTIADLFAGRARVGREVRRGAGRRGRTCEVEQGESRWLDEPVAAGAVDTFIHRSHAK